MGYKAPQKRYNLDFGETDLDGLEVCVKGISTGRFLELSKLLGVADANPEAAEKLIAGFASALVSWNLEDDLDEPLPADEKHVLEQDLGFVLIVIRGWLEAVAGVTPDLGKESTSGPSFPAVNIPTELLSSSLPS